MHTRKTTVGLVVAGACFALGCGPERPAGTLAQAELAIDHAQRNEAPQYALAELQSAQNKLALAREAAADGENEEARRLAEQALAKAQLAEAKAQSGQVEEDVHEKVEKLQEEARTYGAELPPGTTVIEPAPVYVVP